MWAQVDAWQQQRPIRIRSFVERGKSHYFKLQGKRALLRGTIGGTLALAVLALLILVFAWWVNWRSPLETSPLVFTLNPSFNDLVIWGLSAFTAALGWWIWPRTVVIGANDWLRVPGCQWDGTWRGPLHASDIAAVQICDSPDAFQVNLVAKGPEFCRVNVLCDTDPVRAEQVANHLANLLRVPLQVHWGN